MIGLFRMALRMQLAELEKQRAAVAAQIPDLNVEINGMASDDYRKSARESTRDQARGEERGLVTGIKALNEILKSLGEGN